MSLYEAPGEATIKKGKPMRRWLSGYIFMFVGAVGFMTTALGKPQQSEKKVFVQEKFIPQAILRLTFDFSWYFFP